MKNIFRVIGFALAVVAFSAISGLAQSPCDDPFETKQAEYQKFRDNIKPPFVLEKLKAAETGGTNFVTRYKDCEDMKPFVDFINGKMPAVKDTIFKLEVIDPFNNAVKTKDWNTAFIKGKKYIEVKSAEPSSLDVALVLATIGYDRAVEKTDTFNNDTLTLAKLAMDKMKAGMVSTKYGLFTTYEYKTKENALGWMNYIIGYITYARQDKKKEALPFLYATAMSGAAEPKGYPELYTALGDYYRAEALKIDKDRLAKFEANEKKDNDETLAMWALEKGYLDRTLDAYARAYKLASANAKTPAAIEYKNKIYTLLKDIYQFRFDKTDGLDAYLATLVNKPLPDPTMEVKPVKEETPATTTTTSSTTNTTTTNTTTTKPNSTTNTTTKPTNTTTNPSTTTKPTTNTTKPNTSKKPKPTRKRSSR